MPTSTKDLRTDIEAVIAAIGSPWSIALEPWLLHEVDDVPNPVPEGLAHGCAAVGLPASSWLDQDRQLPSLGTTTQTPVFVRFFARVVPADSGTSQDTADDLEAALIAAVLAVSTDFTIRWIGVERSAVSSGEFFRRDVEFLAQHRLPLE